VRRETLRVRPGSIPATTVPRSPDQNANLPLVGFALADLQVLIEFQRIGILERRRDLSFMDWRVSFYQQLHRAGFGLPRSSSLRASSRPVAFSTPAGRRVPA